MVLLRICVVKNKKATKTHSLVALPGSMPGNYHRVLSHIDRAIATGVYDAAQHRKNGKRRKKSRP
jgi:hypothetical protein